MSKNIKTLVKEYKKYSIRVLFTIIAIFTIFIIFKVSYYEYDENFIKQYESVNEGIEVKEYDGKIAISNKYIGRVLDIKEKELTTKYIYNGFNKQFEPVKSDEFLICTDNRKLNNRDFVICSYNVEENDDTKYLSFLLEEKSKGLKSLKIIITYSLSKNDTYIRKNVSLLNDVYIDYIEVERFKSRMKGHGGGSGRRLGQPVFLSNTWYTGLESPSGENVNINGQVYIRQNIKKNISPSFQSFSAVIGTGKDGEVKRSFETYISKIRVSQPKPYLLYNTWYDMRDKYLNHDSIIEKYEILKNRLGNNNLSAVVIDNGWQNPDSLYDADISKFPNGLTPISNKLKQGNTYLGLWMPLSGARALNVSWGQQKGLIAAAEPFDDVGYYCLTDTKYYDSIKEKIRYYIKEVGIGYLKLDWNIVKDDKNCGTIESQVEAIIKLIVEIKKMSPDVYINLTAFYPFPEKLPNTSWPSPWWLMYVDTVWSGGFDYGSEGSDDMSPRDQATTYRDSIIYNQYIDNFVSFPMNSFMTHGFIDGNLNKIGGKDETEESWRNGVIMEFARGVHMGELYISPENINGNRWVFLDNVITWWKANYGILKTSKFYGGNPKAGKIYGYISFQDNEGGVLLLRNPSSKKQRIKIKMDDLLECHLPEVIYTAKATYPKEEFINIQVSKNFEFNIVLNGGEVKVIEVYKQGVDRITLDKQKE